MDDEAGGSPGAPRQPAVEGGWPRDGDGTMRAVWIDEFGGPEVLEVREVPRPRPGRGEVRVRVEAAGLNRADLVQRQGKYPPPEGWPSRVPGLEYAGTVEAVGPGTGLRRVGEPVMGIAGGGGQAEYVVVPERETIRIPEGMTREEAGGVPEVFMTAWDALERRLGLRSGETVLIHAVGSGVGTAALQLARVAGARTVGTARDGAKLRRAGELGLQHGVEGGSGWSDRVRDVTADRGVDAVLDLVGGVYLEENQRALAPGGRHVVVGVPGGAQATIDLRRLMTTRATLVGTVLRARPPEEKAELARDFERRLVPHFEEGRLRPVVEWAASPEEIAEAHRAMEENRTFGKVVLSWED